MASFLSRNLKEKTGSIGKPTEMQCVVCGEKITDDAHVRDRTAFPDDLDDRIFNIIPMCPNHHRLFDKGKIGICQNKEKLLIKREGGIYVKEPAYPMKNVRDKWVREKNEQCDFEVRLRLGVIPGHSHADLCSD